ncbi:MAG TPA: hypothetical protein VJ723_03115 [Candidatus Angelobacter sp.]|nr:hypothetical protein [Candidatus Angelobacter sp.]
MNTDAIVKELEERRDRISHAIGLLQDNARGNGRRGRRKKRSLSPAARKRISDAMKKRWAAKKKAA